MSRRGAAPGRNPDAAWRLPAEVIGLAEGPAAADPRLFRARTRGPFWDLLQELGITLLVTREYEHLVLSLGTRAGRPAVSALPLPHPSGLAVDRKRGIVHVACTRNPNFVLDLHPAPRLLPRKDLPARPRPGGALVPVRARFLPGSFYLHDLAFVGGRLHGNAVGINAVVRLEEGGETRAVWWPKSVESGGRLRADRNYLQLNSIAAGPDLARSFFTASASRPSARRPGHRNFAVDRRGVLLSGATREPVAWGLTRPHSARLHEGAVWVDNSGYGELWRRSGEAWETVARLPGWTRGLCFAGGVAFVGTSRVLPRFAHYAPGLTRGGSICGLHAVDTKSGKTLAALVWPSGDQLFAVEWLPAGGTASLPFDPPPAATARRERALFYAFDTGRTRA
ncbi:MAG TPA: DUF4915 domain-containing protein [Thermoanaerobaculia bacterium]|nr:DUF4915 domain-containing protein [Thermoanaerobaculia bacterium]